MPTSVVRTITAAGIAGSLALTFACIGSEPETGAPAMTTDRCEALAGLDLIDMQITQAEVVPTGETGPEHCRVTGVIETEINFELMLPEAWNGRFMMGGGGGFVGSVQNSALSYGYGAGALARGYATVGTDTGHVGTGIEAGWALHNLERQENFGHRAVHLTSDAAKSIIRHYYDQAPEYSYFVGCSRGGGQGMMESQRYPDDFDGIVSGAPAYHWTAFTAGMTQTQQALYPDGDTSRPVITADVLALLERSVDDACDLQDGVEDGVLNDPRSCGFTADDLPRCSGDEPASDCVTTAQLEALTVIYQGPTSGGESIYAGFPLGDESQAGGWDNWITGSESTLQRGAPTLHYAFGTELYKHFVFGDPEWDFASYDFSTWKDDTAAASEMLDATDTNLSAFNTAGGKMMFWTGWPDPAIPALGTLDYYEAVEAEDVNVRDYARLFMLPGVLHCGGGPGASQVDWLEAIRAWVEDGQAPERLVAHKLADDGEEVVMTRPVCPYPQVAVYDGGGDPDDAASFSCQLP
jgi:feruloyl esterase